MKKSSTVFLQVVIVLVGRVALVLMLWEPHLEGSTRLKPPFFGGHFLPAQDWCLRSDRVQS